ncbi:VOC family protein [uncultured Tenacibaculum sp.]|uniref:VOC family protein n=1 Tax=uncultured Tenacibaculum sp. TaxID=174713 RepID=UPI0026359AB5|nr:VOC family protein [uncultured Tenacibaculum sp.]
MKKLNYLIISIIAFGLFSCKNTKTKSTITTPTEVQQNDLTIDHLNIWVKHPQKAKKRLVELGFTAIPDSLSKVHKGQGTAGKYFYFLNGYLEFIYVYDQKELEQNVSKNKDLDFIERSNFDNNNALPFSVALQLKDYNTKKIPFEKIQYHQDWMEDDSNIYAAKNSKTNLKEPSIFVVYPVIQYDKFNTLEDLRKIPEEYALWRTFYKHENGVRKITKVIITSADLDLNSETIKTVNQIEDVTVKNGSEYLMELYFDDNKQGKSFDLRPELPLKIYL